MPSISNTLARRPRHCRRRSLLESLERRVLMAQTFTLDAAADAYVRDGASATINFGTSAELQLKQTNSTGSNRYVHLKFDVSSVANVSSAKLRIHGRIDDPTAKPQVAVYPATSTGWGETTINWNNQPAVAAGVAPLASVTVATSTAKWYEWDVSSYLAAERAAGHTDVSLVLRSLTITTPHMIFTSGESSTATQRPQLLVTTADPPAPPPQAIVVSTNQLFVAENASQSLGVSLAAQPISNVVVSVSKTVGGDVDLNLGGGNPTSLTFTAADWNVPQLVSIAAGNDADTTAGAASFTISSTGLADKTLLAIEIDDDGAPAPLTFRASADAHVRDGSSAALNFGTSSELHLKRSSSAGFSREIYLKFDISELSPASSLWSVTSAKLGLHGLIHHESHAPTVAVYAVSNTTWSESAINWNNRPPTAVGAAPLATTVVATSTAKFYEWDVTSYVEAERAAGHTSLTLLVRSLTNTDPYLIFASDESAANMPRLAIAQGIPTPPPPPPDPSDLPTIVAAGSGSHTVRISAGRVQLPGGAVVDVAGAVLNLDAPQITSHTYTGKAPPNYANQASNLRWPDGSANLVPTLDTLMLGGLYHAVVPGSVVVRNSTGTVMTRDVDYKLNLEWGQVLNLNSKLGTPGSGSISISYQIVRQRLDLIEVLPNGTVAVKKGTSTVVCPTLPEPDAGAAPLAGVFVFTVDGAKSSGFTIQDREIYPIVPAAPVATINPSSIPKTLGRLAAGQSVNIAYFGDSITDGAEAGQWWSDRSKTYTDLVTQGLRSRFPNASITQTLASQGGSAAVDSQSVFQSRVLDPHNAGNRVDLVVIAMGMNDKGKPTLDPFKAAMYDYIDRARAAGIEVLLVTPMQSNPYYESLQTDRVTRAEIAGAIREVAATKNATCVDVFTEWVNQATRGIAPFSQLHNTFNHPGVAGMKLYADAILRAFPA